VVGDVSATVGPDPLDPKSSQVFVSRQDVFLNPGAACHGDHRRIMLQEKEKPSGRARGPGLQDLLVPPSLVQQGGLIVNPPQVFQLESAS